MIHQCNTCGLSPSFEGWDDCLKCGVAASLVEDPDYINFARRLYADDKVWLKQLEREWDVQAKALASVESLADVARCVA